jgi:hypothetical protein
MIQLMNSSNPPNVRLGAARSVVELGMKTSENADLSARLGELEQRFARQHGSRRR